MRALLPPGGCALAKAFLPGLLCVLASCATYTDRILTASQEASAGNYRSAVATLNKVLGVDSDDELPNSWKADRILATLERGILKQSLQRYNDSARDLSAAEQSLEILDLTRDPVGQIGRYVYSDSAQPYKATPTERLALNPLNLLNYLAIGDLEGAAVEARRFQVMREFLRSEGREAEAEAALGTYLAGFVFEHLGEGDRALRYYDETLAQRRLRQLTDPVRRLARRNPYRGAHVMALLQEPATTEEGKVDLLIVLSVGRVPHKVPARMPVGAAVGIAGAVLTDEVDWLKYGATKVVVYPELVLTPSTLGRPWVRVDGDEVEIEELIDLDALIRREYETMKPFILAAALSRMAARAAAAEGVRAAGKEESDVLGDLLSLLFEGLLVAVDRPDTRSWTMLPARVLVARVPVSDGSHAVEVQFEGVPSATRRAEVQTTTKRFAAVVVSEPR